jgi:pimeloyl-ACP methyl ester carboxylesterase
MGLLLVHGQKVSSVESYRGRTEGVQSTRQVASNDEMGITATGQQNGPTGSALKNSSYGHIQEENKLAEATNDIKEKSTTALPTTSNQTKKNEDLEGTAYTIKMLDGGSLQCLTIKALEEFQGSAQNIVYLHGTPGCAAEVYEGAVALLGKHHFYSYTRRVGDGVNYLDAHKDLVEFIRKTTDLQGKKFTLMAVSGGTLIAHRFMAGLPDVAKNNMNKLILITPTPITKNSCENWADRYANRKQYESGATMLEESSEDSETKQSIEREFEAKRTVAVGLRPGLLKNCEERLCQLDDFNRIFDEKIENNQKKSIKKFFNLLFKFYITRTARENLYLSRDTALPLIEGHPTAWGLKDEMAHFDDSICHSLGSNWRDCIGAQIGEAKQTIASKECDGIFQSMQNFIDAILASQEGLEYKEHLNKINDLSEQFSDLWKLEFGIGKEDKMPVSIRAINKKAVQRVETNKAQALEIAGFQEELKEKFKKNQNWFVQEMMGMEDHYKGLDVLVVKAGHDFLPDDSKHIAELYQRAGTRTKYVVLQNSNHQIVGTVDIGTHIMELKNFLNKKVV